MRVSEDPLVRWGLINPSSAFFHADLVGITPSGATKRTRTCQFANIGNFCSSSLYKELWSVFAGVFVADARELVVALPTVSFHSPVLLAC